LAFGECSLIHIRKATTVVAGHGQHSQQLEHCLAGKAAPRGWAEADATAIKI
jgi:hypothetical protein